jgi:hypothetical protein
MKISLISAPLTMRTGGKNRFVHENNTASPGAEVTAGHQQKTSGRFLQTQLPAADRAGVFAVRKMPTKRGVYACERRLPKAPAL